MNIDNIIKEKVGKMRMPRKQEQKIIPFGSFAERKSGPHSQMLLHKLIWNGTEHDMGELERESCAHHNHFRIADDTTTPRFYVCNTPNIRVSIHPKIYILLAA